MNEKVLEKKFPFYKKRNQQIKPVLIRNNQYHFQQSDSSKSINSSFDNKSEFLKPKTISLLSKMTKIDKIKIKKIISPKDQFKYSNEKLFSNRITKGMLFYNKMKLKDLKSKTLKLEQKIDINKKKDSVLIPRKFDNKEINYFSIDQKPNINLIRPIFSPINNKNLIKKHSTIDLSRLNNVNKKNIFTPKSCSKSFDETFMKKKEQKEKQKKSINENLLNLLNKIKWRVLPKRKLIFQKYKLPNINNIKSKNNKSCIHKEENIKGEIEFIKTHLDGITKQKNNIKSKYKSEKRFEINEGYIDLEVLGDGSNVSFKTNLIEKHGVFYYEFSKSGLMDTIEEKMHKVQKDNNEFKKLLKKYNENEVVKAIQVKDFRNIKKNYGTNSIDIKNNIYKDLYHMIFKDKNNYLEMQKEIQI